MSRQCLGAFVDGKWIAAESGVDVRAIPGALVIRDKADLVAVEKAMDRAFAGLKQLEDVARRRIAKLREMSK